MHARGRAAAGVMLCASIAAWHAMTPTATAQSPPSPSAFAIQLQPDDSALRARVDLAARESLGLFSDWLGPLAGAVTITDGERDAASRVVRIHPPWPPAPSAMDVESEVAFELARLWWPAADSAMSNGAAWYLQSRAIARVFDLVYTREGHSAEVTRFFGGYYPVERPALRFDGPAAGLGRPWLTGESRTGSAPLPTRVSTSVVRVAHAFASLERLVGRPRLAGALRTTVTVATDAQMIQRLSAALGQDLDWLFAPALDPAATVNYAIAAVEVVSCEPQPCYRARVDVKRTGSAVFSGRAAQRAGAFASGDAIGVRVDFADGQSAVARWDGRDVQRRFDFQGTSAPVRVQLDADGVMLVDDNWLDQSRVLRGATNAPLGKWVARWLVWLQTSMLAYSSLV